MGLDFIYILKAIVIAIVEGLTEFVPVSSTGHMILVGSLINFRSGAPGAAEFASMFEVVIQLGAILAVVVLYWNKLWGAVVEFFTFIFSGGKKGQSGFRFGINVIIGSIPALIVGLTLYDKIKGLFKPSAVVVGFIVGGILLLVIENRFRNRASKIGKTPTTDVFNITPVQAIKVGLFQVLSMWPGMSRSASTIMGGWIAGLSTPVGAEFSFFLAVPAMVGSSAMDLLNFDYSMAGGDKANKIKLLKAFDDGINTYFEFSDKVNLPAIYVVDINGKETNIKYIFDGPYVVVTGVHMQFSLRITDEIVCVFNNSILF